MLTFATICTVFCYLISAHLLSYRLLKRRYICSQRWELNICSGDTDGGGINADIIFRKSVPRFVLVDVYRLPFRDKQFSDILCSHTMEHVEDPERFYEELMRVGKSVSMIIPPLWDVWAMFDFFEHKWIFLTFRKVHTTLPRRVRLPLTQIIHGRFGQKIR
ncbi:MAG: class I SAM-dependent methyltransferase [bacterium]